MRSSDNQLDIFRDDPAISAAREANACRQAAATALVDPHWSRVEQQARHAHYLREAARIEAKASGRECHEVDL
ncbi:hypothetical protein [Stenotrophomonas sp. PS02298]|uniref:hypothetical protein n=1 Tax=Stenotrophomonas sp. PS02298 TaxID=2991424 RepID=UPI00249A5931|nr:hypothetical protein [Stenotrophomonas sp. PS02298]